MGESNYAVAKYNYEPQRQDELQLTRGDTVTVLERSSDGWWKGQINSNIGWFPSNYVDPMPENTNGASAQPYPADYSASTGHSNNQPVLEVCI